MHKTVHYLALDPLQNLRIKVTLKKVQGARRVQDGENEENEGDNVKEMTSTRIQFKEPTPDGLNISLRWQEKRFGPREVFDYSKMTDSPAALSMLDQHNLTAIEDEKKEAATDGRSFQGHTIHTMVHRDNYVDLNDLFRKYTTSSKEVPSVLTQKLLDPLAQTQGKQGTVPTPAEKAKAMESGHGGVNGGLLEHDLQCMYILASFTNTGPAQELLADAHQQRFWMGETHPLCAIRALTNNSFDMQPGFSSGAEDAEPYRFTLIDGSIYEYTLENMSTIPESVAKVGRQSKGARTTREAQRRQLELRRNIVGQEFTKPPYRKGIINLHSIGEIVSLSGFDTDDSLFIDYTIHLPLGWRIEPENTPLQGVTQMSKVQYIKTFRDVDEQAVAHLGFPFSHVFIYEGLTDHRGDHQETGDQQTLSPKVFFQVTTVDFWLRQRALGYGTVNIPLQPGFHQMDIQTWRPAGTVRTRMREFYIGGSYELSDLTAAEAPPDFEGHLLNKYGFRSETAGTIKFRTNVVTQTHVPKKKAEKKTFKGLISKHRKNAGIAHLSARVAQIKASLASSKDDKASAMGRMQSRKALKAGASGAAKGGGLASLVTAVSDVKKSGGDVSALHRTSVLSRLNASVPGSPSASSLASPTRKRETREERLARIRAQREASKGKKAQ